MRTLHAVLGGYLLGVGTFFTFAVPQVAFATLHGHDLGALLGALFPRFYLLVAVAAALFALAGIAAHGMRSLPAITALIALALTLAAWIWILPAVQAAEGTQAFGYLHGLSLGLDLIAMLLWLAGLLAGGAAARRSVGR